MYATAWSLPPPSGGGAAFGRWAEKHIRSRRGVQAATFLLGLLIFIDDYFNCLTVGSVMQPLCYIRYIRSRSREA
ncbi:MAG: hypothetical protein K6G80_01590 [Treponema sp.]|nr:hypothetical protein [Treponema sp.]